MLGHQSVDVLFSFMIFHGSTGWRALSMKCRIESVYNESIPSSSSLLISVIGGVSSSDTVCGAASFPLSTTGICGDTFSVSFVSVAVDVNMSSDSLGTESDFCSIALIESDRKLE